MGNQAEKTETGKPCHAKLPGGNDTACVRDLTGKSRTSKRVCAGLLAHV